MTRQNSISPKNALRQKLLNARQGLSPEDRHTADISIGKYLYEWLRQHPATCLGIYLPIRQEPNLSLTYKALADEGLQLALPVVMSAGQPLAFAAWQPGEALVHDKFGTSVPVARTLVNPDVLLIPCVGFNQDKFRIGYGGGYYDRTLDLPNRPATIGIAYAISHAGFTPEKHDIAMDIIMTDQQVF